MGQDLQPVMERAGEALARLAQRIAGTGEILVACGGGNNGGDGYVCARLLAAAGRTVSVWPVMPPASDLCRLNRDRLPATVTLIKDVQKRKPALIVDAVLGAGTRGALRPPIPAALVALRGTGAPVLAADVPSGINTSDVLPAVLTVCFQAMKRELRGNTASGECTVVDVGLDPRAWLEVQPSILRRFPLLGKKIGRAHV